MNFRYLKYNQNWNIGFFSGTPDSLLKNKSVGVIQWMKHEYKDRWFADPFIYDVTDTEIIVFAEECEILNPLGRIVELILDKETKVLKHRYLLLSLNTHLSYPAFIKTDAGTIVYPENGKAGTLHMYDYDEDNHKLINPRKIMDAPVADATIFQIGKKYMAVATKYPGTQQGAYLYTSENANTLFSSTDEIFNNDRSCSRPGGNIFQVNGKCYRPAQDCVARYGAALSIMEMELGADGSISEKKVFTLSPKSFRYNLGLHTLNFHGTMGVVDGYGYYYPIIGRILNVVRIIKRLIR